MKSLHRRSVMLIVVVWAFSACSPTDPFDPVTVPEGPNYDDGADWLCRPEIDSDLCDWVPPNDFGWADNQATAEADCFFVHGSTMVMNPNSWNTTVDHPGDFGMNDLLTPLFPGAFNGACRIFAPRYRDFHGWAVLTSETPEDYANLKQARDVAYSDVSDAWNHYLQNENGGRPFYLVGHSQGSMHLERLIREEIEGTALADELVAAYLIEGFLRRDSFNQTPYCGDATATGCVVGWGTVANSFRLGDPYALGVRQPVDSQLRWMEEIDEATPDPHCTNPLSWTVDGGRIEDNPGSVSYFHPHQVVPDVVGAECRDFDPDPNREVVLLSVDHLTGLDMLKYVPPGLLDYHGHGVTLFYKSIRDNAQDRLDSYLQ